MAMFETIKIEKGMYASKGKSLTDVLEELDPSENYKGTSLEGLDAFQRQQISCPMLSPRQQGSKAWIIAP